MKTTFSTIIFKICVDYWEVVELWKVEPIWRKQVSGDITLRGVSYPGHFLSVFLSFLATTRWAEPATSSWHYDICPQTQSKGSSWPWICGQMSLATSQINSKAVFLGILSQWQKVELIHQKRGNMSVQCNMWDKINFREREKKLMFRTRQFLDLEKAQSSNRKNRQVRIN
jgi:hypothetical protein